MRRRASLITLLSLVAILAVGLAAMKVATDAVMRASFVSGFLALLIGTLGAIVRREGAWIGFALFGWASSLAMLASPVRDVIAPLLRPEESMGDLVGLLHPEPARPAARSPFAVQFDEKSGQHLKLSGVYPNASVVPASPSETQAWKAWNSTGEAHERWRVANGCAPKIGFVMAAISFSCLGALAGHLLDERSKPVGMIPGDRSTPTSG